MRQTEAVRPWAILSLRGDDVQNTFITVNGSRYPYPDCESGLQTQSTNVSGGLNNEGIFIGQRVGRDKSKVELKWTIMEAQTWASLLQQFERKFVSAVEYYDMAKGAGIVRHMYVNDRTAGPFRIDPATGIWLIARDCKLNLIDTGR